MAHPVPPRGTGAGPGRVPDASRAHHRAVAAGGRHRYRRPRAGGSLLQGVRPAVLRREQARRRQHHRHRGRGARGARRLHAPDDGEHARAEQRALQEGAVRPGARLRPDHARRDRALAVSGPRRVEALPNVPPVADAVPGYEAMQWYGLLAPAGVPGRIIARLHAEALTALRSREMKDRLATDGAEPLGSTPAEFAAFIRRELEKWGRVVETARIERQ